MVNGKFVSIYAILSLVFLVYNEAFLFYNTDTENTEFFSLFALCLCCLFFYFATNVVVQTHVGIFNVAMAKLLGFWGVLWCS